MLADALVIVVCVVLSLLLLRGLVAVVQVGFIASGIGALVTASATLSVLSILSNTLLDSPLITMPLLRLLLGAFQAPSLGAIAAVATLYLVAFAFWKLRGLMDEAAVALTALGVKVQAESKKR